MATARQIKAKVKKAEACVDRWRTKLKLDGKWTIKVLADLEDPEENLMADADFDMGEYWSATICLKKKLLESKEYDADLDETISHELLHIVFYPYSSFVRNFVSNNAALEAQKLEEQIVTQLQRVLGK